MSKFYQVFIGLGSNQEPKLTNLQTALTRMEAHPKIRIQAQSSFYKSKAVGLDEENPLDFINQVCCISTNLMPKELLNLCQEIEEKQGRKRQLGLTLSRPIDLDILFFDNLIVQEKVLQVPHSQAYSRNFVLIPLAEIIPSNWRDPLYGLSCLEMVENLQANSQLIRL